MSRLLPKLIFAALSLSPALALADLPPPPGGGCSRCSVEQGAGLGGAAFSLLGVAGLVALRRRR